MRITALQIDDRVGEKEAAISIAARCSRCGKSLRAYEGNVDMTAWSESENLVVIPLHCVDCNTSHALHLNILTEVRPP